MSCELCEKNDSDYPCETELDHHFTICRNMLFYYDVLKGWTGFPIKFCPVCGRILENGLHTEVD